MAATVKNLASCNYPNGVNPTGDLLMDANGDLFGTTSGGGTSASGTVFEIVNTATGYASLTTLVSFNGTSTGYKPLGGLIADASGNLFGTTANGGANGLGEVFEIVNTATGYANTPLVIASFSTKVGYSPMDSLIADSSGDLFGTTQYGPTGTTGAIFEILNTGTGYSSTPVLVSSFKGNTNGAQPIGSLITDANGDLFGTTASGGTSGTNDGTIFEVVKTGTTYAATPTMLASFDNKNGSQPQASLMMDASGNLLGTTQYGGASNRGTVFELANTGSSYAGTITPLFSFNLTNGGNPTGGLLADANGDLFGTTQYGGSSGFGTVFEILNTVTGYATSPITVISLNGTVGANPWASLIADSAGNLFATTNSGGLVSGSPSSLGAVIEVSNSGFVVACFAAGTRITTPEGEVPVQALAVGDPVRLARGGEARIEWIGHRRVDCAHHPRPELVWPVRIAAHAFGPGRPQRDLWLSPDHAVFRDGMLIPIKYLIDDARIVQAPVDAIEYWHVRLSRHDILLADGLEAESYLDTGDLPPDIAWEALGCAPLVALP